MADVRLRDVAGQVGLDFQQGSFRFGVSADPVAMMGGGLCWLDYDRDGWVDLFVVNSYSERDFSRWKQKGGPPGSVLFHNVKGKFVDVSRPLHARLAVRGTGCVAADLDQDGHTDLYVTAAGRARCSGTTATARSPGRCRGGSRRPGLAYVCRCRRRERGRPT